MIIDDLKNKVHIYRRLNFRLGGLYAKKYCLIFKTQ